jgi:hypothetical protein
MLKIAMRACRLMLSKEILDKEPNAHTWVDENILPKGGDINSQREQIAKLYGGAKKGSEILRYATFFTDILPSMLHSGMDIPTFEMRLVRALVPIAPYLQCFIEGHENWTPDN